MFLNCVRHHSLYLIAILILYKIINRLSYDYYYYWDDAILIFDVSVVFIKMILYRKGTHYTDLQINVAIATINGYL